MNKYLLVVCVLLCALAVNGRHYTERSEELERNNDRIQDNDNVHNINSDRSTPRHRRKRWQMNYRYNYPPSSYYPDDRRDDRNPDVLGQIYRLLDDIYAYVRRPPPPPPPQQPIFVPVPYPGYPQYCNCGDRNHRPNKHPRPKPDPNLNVTFPVRGPGSFPDMEDSNQNWGFVDTDNFDNYDDGTDGVRPISFEPMKPNVPTTRPPLPVEHGTVEGAAAATPVPAPAKCDTTILSCCRPADSQAQQRQCFLAMNCLSVFANGEVCKIENILRVIDTFQKAYSPIINN